MLYVGTQTSIVCVQQGVLVLHLVQAAAESLCFSRFLLAKLVECLILVGLVISLFGKQSDDVLAALLDLLQMVLDIVA